MVKGQLSLRKLSADERTSHPNVQRMIDVLRAQPPVDYARPRRCVWNSDWCYKFQSRLEFDRHSIEPGHW